MLARIRPRLRHTLFVGIGEDEEAAADPWGWRRRRPAFPGARSQQARIPPGAASLALSSSAPTPVVVGQYTHACTLPPVVIDLAACFGSTCSLYVHTHTLVHTHTRIDRIRFDLGRDRDACVRTDKIVCEYVMRCRRLLLSIAYLASYCAAWHLAF